MAFFDTTWYVSSNLNNGNTTGYFAVTQRPQNAAVAAGAVARQFTLPAAGSARCFACIVAGTTANTTDATWTITRGAKTTDGTVTWIEITGCAAMNGDATNTPNWTTVKNQAVSQGQVIQRNNGASYQVCTTAGTAGNGAEPGFSDTAGTTTADNTVTWTSLGVVGNFTKLGAPFEILFDAFTTNWALAGNTVFVADNHNESVSNGYTITGVGTLALPIFAVCFNHSGNFPPQSSDVTTGAVVLTTGASSIILAGNQYHVGIRFAAGSGGLNNAQFVGANGSCWQKFVNCSLEIASGSNGAASNIAFGNTTTPQAAYVELVNTQVKFGGAASQLIWVLNVEMVWRNSVIAGSGTNIPTSLFGVNSGVSAANVGTHALIEGCDLSGFTGSALATVSVSNVHGRLTFKDCKLNSTYIVSAPTAPMSWLVDLIRCSSGANNYISERYRYEANETTETTIVRTGGATDGTTAQSRKIVTTANVGWTHPYEAFPLAIWNTVVGSTVTVTVYGIWGGGAVPNNDDIWIDVEYLGSSTAPLGSFASLTKANLLAANAPLASDSSTWGGSTTPFKMTVQVTPQMVGPITVYVKAAKPSTTFYIDPKPVLS